MHLIPVFSKRKSVETVNAVSFDVPFSNFRYKKPKSTFNTLFSKSIFSLQAIPTLSAEFRCIYNEICITLKIFPRDVIFSFETKEREKKCSFGNDNINMNLLALPFHGNTNLEGVHEIFAKAEERS